MGLLCAEQDVGNLKQWTFRNFGTPVRRTRRRKSQKNDFQDFWDSCEQNRTSEISKYALSRILGLLCAEQNVGNLKQCTVRNSGTPVRRTKRRKSQNNGLSIILGLLCAEQNVGQSTVALSEIRGLLCAEQNVGYLKKCIVINSGTLVRRGWRPSAAPLCGFLCFGSKRSTCPSSQHSRSLASHVMALNKTHVSRLNT